MDEFKRGLALLLLLGQLAAILYARFVPTRYFCWAPYDQHTRYELRAEIAGRELTHDEIGKRYRLSWAGFDPRSPAHIWDVIEHVEARTRPASRARVTMHYTLNGKARPDWHFPANQP